MTDNEDTSQRERAFTAWERSVQAARAANRNAIEGRFVLTLASYEAFPVYGRGIPYQRTDRTVDANGLPVGNRGRMHRSLLDWCDEVGVNYNTLNRYRQLVSWWFESDPIKLRDEIGVPDNIAWEALRAARTHWTLAVDFRATLAACDGPANGRMFSLNDVEYLARVREPIKRKTSRTRSHEERFDSAVGEVLRTGERLTRTLGFVTENELDGDEVETLLSHARQAQEAANRLVLRLVKTRADLEPDVVAV